MCLAYLIWFINIIYYENVTKNNLQFDSHGVFSNVRLSAIRCFSTSGDAELTVIEPILSPRDGERD